MKAIHPRALAAVVLVGFAGAAAAHTGHGTASFFQGLVHPFGLDHLLAMVAVGVWSVFALPARRAWTGPVTFVLAMMASAGLAVMGLKLPFLEFATAASVFVFGAMLLLATRFAAPQGVGLAVVALAAVLHGLAHGAEAPPAGVFNYAVGFVLTTACLHLGGVVAGLSLRRWTAERTKQIVGGLGLAYGGAGLLLLSQI